MKLLRIDIKAEVDPYPDLSYLGDYSSNWRKFAIDRKVRHSQERGEHRYFHPAYPPAPGMSQKERRECWNRCEMDYERMESYNNKIWQMLFIQAFAEVDIGGVIQRVTSGGIGGVESDSGQDYLDLIEAEQKEELASILKEMGFRKKTIRKAM